MFTSHLYLKMPNSFKLQVRFSGAPLFYTESKQNVIFSESGTKQCEFVRDGYLDSCQPKMSCNHSTFAVNLTCCRNVSCIFEQYLDLPQTSSVCECEDSALFLFVETPWLKKKEVYFHVLFMFVYDIKNLVVELCISDVIL